MVQVLRRHSTSSCSLFLRASSMAVKPSPLVWRGCSLDHPMMIEEDMCFAIETQEGDGEGQGVRIEEVIRVTKTGVEILSKWPVKELTVIEC